MDIGILSERRLLMRAAIIPSQPLDTPAPTATEALSVTVTMLGSFSSNTIITPPQTYNVHKPALTIAIKMSNNEKSLEPYGMVTAGVKARPSDAAVLIQSLPKSRQIAPAVENRRARMARGRSLSAFVPGSNKMLHPFEENLTESRILL